MVQQLRSWDGTFWPFLRSPELMVLWGDSKERTAFWTKSCQLRTSKNLLGCKQCTRSMHHLFPFLSTTFVSLTVTCWCECLFPKLWSQNLAGHQNQEVLKHRSPGSPDCVAHHRQSINKAHLLPIATFSLCTSPAKLLARHFFISPHPLLLRCTTLEWVANIPWCFPQGAWPSLRDHSSQA